MRHIYITLSFLILGYATLPCDCVSEGTFLKVASKSNLVALVKVTKYLTFKNINDERTPMSMEVEVIDVYRGKERRKKVIVWGDNGSLCRPYLSRFSLGKYYVIAFYKAYDGSKGDGHKEERTSDYTISICGDYWLHVDMHKQRATGAVMDKQKEIKLSKLKTKLSQK